MVKIQKYLFFAVAVLFFMVTNNTFAFNTQINAGLLKNVWYSNTDVYEKDQIKIFGGIYNQSTTTFSGVVITYLDNKEIGRESFVSKPESLIEISSKWTAEKGRFSVQIKLADIVFNKTLATSSQSTNSLLSSESENSTLSVNNKITLEEVKTTVTNVTTNILASIDDKAEELSEQILTLKKPVEEAFVPLDTSSNTVVQNNSSSKTTDLAVKKTGSVEIDSTPEVLGAQTIFKEVASTSAGIFSKVKNSSFVTNIYNKLIDLLSMIVKYWRITLFVIIVLILLFKFFM